MAGSETGNNYHPQMIAGFSAALFATMLANFTISDRDWLVDVALGCTAISLPGFLLTWRIADADVPLDEKASVTLAGWLVLFSVSGYLGIALIIFRFSLIAGGLFVVASLICLRAAPTAGREKGTKKS